MAVSQEFIFSFKCYSILHFAVYLLLRWPFLFLLQMHHKKVFDLENEGQSHRVQDSQWSHLMANIFLCKSHM